MPQAYSIFVTRALAAAGIEFEAYGWREIKDGKAPISTMNARLRAIGNPVCTKHDAICAILSNVPKRYLLEASAQVRKEPLDPDIVEYRAAIASRETVSLTGFDTREDEDFCGNEILAIHRDEIRKLLKTWTHGTVHFSAPLDPAMYAHSDKRVVFADIHQDATTGALRMYETSQINVFISEDSRGRPCFSLGSALLDTNAPTSVPIDANLLELVRHNDDYANSTPLRRAFLERCANPAHDSPMQFKPGEPSEEVIYFSAPKPTDGLTCCVFMGASRSGIMFSNSNGQFVPGPYANLDGRQQMPSGIPASDEFFDLADPVIHRALASDHPEMAELFEDLRAIYNRVWQETINQAVDVMRGDSGTGTLPAAVIDEETHFPTDAGLFFPQRCECGLFMAYDDPEAAPYIEQLRNSDWDGQV